MCDILEMSSQDIIEMLNGVCLDQYDCHYVQKALRVYQREKNPKLLVACVKLSSDGFHRRIFTEIAMFMATCPEITVGMVKEFMNELKRTVRPRIFLENADPEKMKVLADISYLFDL